MKWWNVLLLCLATLLLAAALLVWFMPARWVAPWLNERMQGAELRGVSGSVWDGQAEALRAADGELLGRLRWTISRWTLLGRPSGHVALAGPVFTASGDLARVRGALQLRDVRLDVALDAMARPLSTPWGRPLGDLHARVARATLRGGWPESLTGRLDWPTARIDAGSGPLPLGHLVAVAHGAQGVIQMDLGDDGSGPLHLDGRLQLSPLGWRLMATLAPRGDDPQLRHWLARLGPVDARGVVHLQHGAGLGALSSSSGVSR